MALVCGALALQGCGPEPVEEESVRTIFEQLRAGQFEEVEAKLSKELRTPKVRSDLMRFRNEIIPEEQPDSIERLHWGFEQSTDLRRITSIDQYAYQDLFLIVVTTLKMDEPSGYTIENLSIRKVAAEEARVNEFTLGKPPGQLAFFGALIMSVVVMVATVVAVLRTRSLKRKWLWMIICLVGAPVFIMNWTTGEWAVESAAGLINAGVSRGLSPAEPWIMQFHIPIGALVALWIVSRQRRRGISVGDRES